MKGNTGKKIFLVLLLIYLFVPMLAIFLFSLTDEWDTTILPVSYTFKYYIVIFSDPKFTLSMLETVGISMVTCIVCVIIMVPCIYLTTLYLRNSKSFLRYLHYCLLLCLE